MRCAAQFMKSYEQDTRYIVESTQASMLSWFTDRSFYTKSRTRDFGSFLRCLLRQSGNRCSVNWFAIYFINPIHFFPLLQLSVVLKVVSMTALFVAISYLGICNCKFCVRILFLRLLKLCVKLPVCTLWGQLKHKKCILNDLSTFRTKHKGFSMS
jgi:hypothetical protein